MKPCTNNKCVEVYVLFYFTSVVSKISEIVIFNMFFLLKKIIENVHLPFTWILQMTLKMAVLLTAGLFCTATAIFHRPSYYPSEPFYQQHNYTGKSQRSLHYYLLVIIYKWTTSDIFWTGWSIMKTREGVLPPKHPVI